MYQSRKLALAALAAIGVLPVGSANAQYYYGAAYPQPAPLYPYAASQPVQQDYERYVRTRRQQNIRRSQDDMPVSSIRTRKSYSRDTVSQRELIEELRRRPSIKRVTINTKPVIVNEPPVVIERYRKGKPVTKVIETYTEADEPRSKRRKDKRAAKGDVRIIRAEAEVKIIGKDQMSIKLYRKGGAPSAAID
jgi:hypothetical protein